ncbi:hypothetical protein EL17_06185 [Anditalea andensis]|uniref:Uncharacterized protein n=2 Tax=Anditalea andensis TaxID=1048983 RepID=A0A074LMX2_9BACT|nr:hypothetical protein EL17_06185 [Anditalea andensis]
MQDWAVLSEGHDPLNILEDIYSLNNFSYGRKRMLQIMESSLSKFPNSAYKKEPALFVFQVKLMQELVIALYLIEENKSDYVFLKNKFDLAFLEKIHSNTYKEHNLPWQFYPISLTKKDLKDPIGLITKVKEIVPLEYWLEFLDECALHGLSFGFAPDWDGSNHQISCTYYLPKLYDIGYLIYVSETKYGRKYVLKMKEKNEKTDK